MKVLRAGILVVALAAGLALVPSAAPAPSPTAPVAAVEQALPLRTAAQYRQDVLRAGRVLTAYARTLQRIATSGTATAALRKRLRTQTLAFSRRLAAMRKYRVDAAGPERQRRRLVGPRGRNLVQAMQRLNVAVGQRNAAAIARAAANLTARVRAWR